MCTESDWPFGQTLPLTELQRKSSDSVMRRAMKGTWWMAEKSRMMRTFEGFMRKNDMTSKTNDDCFAQARLRLF